MTKMLCHITDEQVPNDPQSREDENPYVCKCGEAKRLDDEFCPACEQDFRDSIREAAKMDRAMELQSAMEDVIYALGGKP